MLRITNLSLSLKSEINSKSASWRQDYGQAKGDVVAMAPFLCHPVKLLLHRVTTPLTTPVGVQSIASVCLSVCVRTHISRTTHQNLTNLVAIKYVICISGFVDDVMFSYSGPYSSTKLRQQHRCNVQFIAKSEKWNKFCAA